MNHRQQFGDLVKRELDKWKLTEQGWGYGYDNWKRTIGRCYYKDKTLVFSLPFIDNNPLDKLLDTIRHEVGHALTPGHGHTGMWKVYARIVGYEPKACDTTGLSIPCKYLAACLCGNVARWHRKPRHEYYLCGKCRNKIYPQLVEE